VRARAMQRHLRGVEALPDAEAVALLGGDMAAIADADLDSGDAIEDDDLATIGRSGK